ncbi:MAG: hypothetical protein HQM04_17785 [Magnetococcales bacterium]|nr:hypothetical protein [Magnetococcales bacterium]MBF0116881.1 hypothetical protein [Magnetococcales bacterium]
MAIFRAEIVFDNMKGKYYVEMFYPENATRPFVTSDSIYESEEEAQNDVILKIGLVYENSKR